MEIKPTYVTFQQAKLLKEKGLNEDTLEIECNQGYDFRGSGDLQHHGRHISSHLFYSAPEQWQVIEWLRVKHGIHIQYLTHGVNKTYAPFIGELKEQPIQHWFKTPQEAYSAALDYILSNNFI